MLEHEDEREEELDPPVLNQHTMERWVVTEGDDSFPNDITEVPVKSYLRPDAPEETTETPIEDAFAAELVDPRQFDGGFRGNVVEVPEPKSSESWAWIILIIWCMIGTVGTATLIYSWWIHGFWNFMKVQ